MRQVAPAEGEIAIALLSQVRKPPRRLFQVWNMPGWYRPHDEMRRPRLFEPISLAVVELLVDCHPHKALKRFYTLPHRQVDRHGRVARRTDGSRIVAVVLEPPHEPLAALSESIDAIEVRHERRHARIIRRITEPAYVELGNMAYHALLRRGEHRLAVRIGCILVDAPLDLGSEMGDEPLNRPGCGVAEGANRMPFDLLGDVQQHVDLAFLRATLNHALHDAPHPSGAFATGRALAAALMLVEIRQAGNRPNDVGRLVHHNRRRRAKAGLELGE